MRRIKDYPLPVKFSHPFIHYYMFTFNHDQNHLFMVIEISTVSIISLYAIQSLKTTIRSIFSRQLFNMK